VTYTGQGSNSDRLSSYHSSVVKVPLHRLERPAGETIADFRRRQINHNYVTAGVVGIDRLVSSAFRSQHSKCRAGNLYITTAL
jgi:hypothetical protein